MNNTLVRRRNLFPSLGNIFNSLMNDPGWDLSVDFFPKSNVTINYDKKGYYLRTDVPGYEDNDIKVEVKDGIISLSGKVEKADKFRSSSSSFSYSYSLPDDVNQDEICAEKKNGVLLVTLPRKMVKEKDSPIKQIKVNG